MKSVTRGLMCIIGKYDFLVPYVIIVLIKYRLVHKLSYK